MNRLVYYRLAEQSIAGEIISDEVCRQILVSAEIELLPLLDAAFEVRKKYFGKEVLIHILNNAQNGYCPEDCNYCAQSKSAQSEIAEYPLKTDQEILAEARQAYENGAFRYCMVFAGRGPSQKRIDHLAGLVKKIKAQYPVQVCVSAGLLDEEKARILKDAGLDRLNHNLNTSARLYSSICSTHTYTDRINTLNAAKAVGLELCSGVIVGMGENQEDVIDVAKNLRNFNVRSIPVNFFIPIEGTRIVNGLKLSPEYCLRVLCLYRLLNPDAEIRVAAGREIHLRGMEAMSLFPANSLFLEGYLNVKGAARTRTLRMIKDAGFTIKSGYNIDELINAGEDSFCSYT